MPDNIQAVTYLHCMKVFRIKKCPFFISLMVTLIVLSHIYGCEERTPNKIHTTSLKPYRELRFHKQGELTFFDKNRKSIVTIDIEIPGTLKEISTGLMFRQKMAENEGMLFGHDKFKARFYWMKNTYIPLDMIFADNMMKIIEIRKTTTPLSAERIPVPLETQYTIEVNGGFCDRYGIKVGNKIVIQSL